MGRRPSGWRQPIAWLKVCTPSARHLAAPTLPRRATPRRSPSNVISSPTAGAPIGQHPSRPLPRWAVGSIEDTGSHNNRPGRHRQVGRLQALQQVWGAMQTEAASTSRARYSATGASCWRCEAGALTTADAAADRPHRRNEASKQAESIRPHRNGEGPCAALSGPSERLTAAAPRTGSARPGDRHPQGGGSPARAPRKLQAC